MFGLVHGCATCSTTPINMNPLISHTPIPMSSPRIKMKTHLSVYRPVEA